MPTEPELDAEIAKLRGPTKPSVNIKAEIESVRQSIRNPESFADNAKRMDDLVRSIAEGVTLGTADEIAAGLNSLFFGGSFDERLLDQRIRNEQIGPGTRLAGNIIGGVVSPATKLAAGAGIVRGVTGGVATGAIAGAGFAEGDAGERLEGAARGAVTGGAFGAAIPASIAAGGAFVRGSTKLLGYGQQISERTLAVARAKVARVFDRKGVSKDEIIRRLDELGDDSIIADLATGDSGISELLTISRGTAAAPGKTPGLAKDVLLARAAGQSDEVKGIITDVVSGKDFGQTLQQLTATRKAAAKQLYEEAAEEVRGQFKGTAIFKLIEDSAILQKAIKDARKFPDFKNAPDGSFLLVDKAFKRLVSMANVAKRKGDNQMMRDIVVLKGQLLDEIKKESPAYGKAVAQWSDDMSMVEAIESGLNFLKTGVDDTVDAVSQMDQGQKDLYLIGVAKAIRLRLDKVTDGRSVIRSIFGSPEIRDKVRAAFPSDVAFNKFQRTMSRMALKAQTKTEVLSGSRTAPLAADLADLASTEAEVAKVARDTVFGGIMGGIAGLGGRAAVRFKQGGEDVRDALGAMMFTPGREAQRTILDEIFEQGLQQQARQRAMQAAIIGGTVGAVSATPVLGR